MVLLAEGHGATALKHEAATRRITLSPLKLPRLGSNLDSSEAFSGERGEGTRGEGLLPIVGIGRQIIGLLGSALFTNQGHAFKKGVS